MQAFLEYVVSGLVQHPEAVSVTAERRGDATVFELRTHPDDVGKIIGRRGMTIGAIRTLIQAGAGKAGERCSVEIIDDHPRRPGRE